MGIRSNRAELAARTGDYGRAMAAIQPVIEYFDRSDQRRMHSTPFIDQLVWDGASARYQDLVARGEKLLPEARGLGPIILHQLLDSLGDAYIGAQRFTDARKSYLDAIAAIESVKLSGGEDERENFFHEKCGPYLGMARLLIRDGKPFEALQYSERAKARLLLDVLRGARTEINQAMTEEEKQHERDLTNQIGRLDGELAAEGAHVKPEMLARRDQLKSEMDSLLAELYQKHPDQVGATRRIPASCGGGNWRVLCSTTPKRRCWSFVVDHRVIGRVGYLCLPSHATRRVRRTSNRIP